MQRFFNTDVVNSVALQMAGISAATDDPERRRAMARAPRGQGRPAEALASERPAALPPAEAIADTTPAPLPPAAPAPSFAVQVAALETRAAADTWVARLGEAGHDAHVVADDDGLFKVRVGSFASRTESEALARQLAQAIGGRPFVVTLP